MAKLCTQVGCRAVVTDGGYRCAEHATVHTPKRRYDHHYHNGKNIYWTNRWKRARAIVLREEPLCRMCDRFGIVTKATLVDHVHEIKDGADPFDRSNMMALCHNCHNTKTGKVAKERRNKEKLNGFKSLSDY